MSDDRAGAGKRCGCRLDLLRRFDESAEIYQALYDNPDVFPDLRESERRAAIWEAMNA